MAKGQAGRLSDKPIDAADIKVYLSTQDDLALELFVYRQARELGLSATHAGTYTDPVTSKPRQYDIRAWRDLDGQRIELPIECKALRPSYPLLISRIPRIEEESFHDVMASRHRVYGSRYMSPARPPGASARARGDASLYRVGQPVGKSMQQIGRNGEGQFTSSDTDVFDKWSQALASADELISQAEDAYHRRNVALAFTCVLPALVVSDSTLWVADYDDAGSLVGEPTQVDEALFYVDRGYGGGLRPDYTVSHLHVYTKSGIVKLMKQVATSDEFWQRVFETGVQIEAATTAA